jgi:NDP-sugar pyrophosphorylase family protein
MLPVGGRPMLANLIDGLTQNNFCDIYISTSYLAAQIEDYFGDGSNWGCSIKYLRENKELGTAGPLALLPTQSNKPILIVNGDLVTKVNFSSLLEFHHKSQFDFTVGSSTYSVEIPFGVMDINPDGTIRTVSEKPVLSFPVNAGIYVVKPEIASLVLTDTHFTMTELVDRAIAKGFQVGAFPIHERWLDVGLPEQYKSAQKETTVVSKNPIQSNSVK